MRSVRYGTVALPPCFLRKIHTQLFCYGQRNVAHGIDGPTPVKIDGFWKAGGSEGAAFASDAPFSKFKQVLVDDSVVDPANYTAWEGSNRTS